MAFFIALILTELLHESSYLIFPLFSFLSQIFYFFKYFTYYVCIFSSFLLVFMFYPSMVLIFLSASILFHSVSFRLFFLLPILPSNFFCLAPCSTSYFLLFALFCFLLLLYDLYYILPVNRESDRQYYSSKFSIGIIFEKRSYYFPFCFNVFPLLLVFGTHYFILCIGFVLSFSCFLLTSHFLSCYL